MTNNKTHTLTPSLLPVAVREPDEGGEEKEKKEKGEVTKGMETI